MKVLYSFFFLLFTAHTNGQVKEMSKFSIGTNLFSLAEPHTGIGVCAGYRINDKLALWSEFTYFFNAKYIINTWENFKGVRIIAQPRYYFKTKKPTFVALEYRLKTSDFISKLNYYNTNIDDTLLNFSTNERQQIIAGAALWGKQIKLRERFFVEFTVGFGARIRKIKRQNIPTGYEDYKSLIYNPLDGSKLITDSYFERENGTAWYVPLGLRVLFKL